MNRKRLVTTRLCAAIVAMLLMQGLANAQGTLGRLAGTVLDTSGAVLPGATVTLTNLDTNQVQTTVSNDVGAFLFPQLPVGPYSVTIELPGFRTANYPDVMINVNQEYSLTARLELGEMTEVVEVLASSPLVQTTTPEVNRTVEQKQVLQLPIVNRDMTQLIRMMPGVPAVATRLNTGINGGRASWTQVTLDGINIQDNFIRVNSLDFLPNRPTSDNVSEFTITTSVQGADAAGGATAVRMVTPSGSNQFRGSVFWQNRNNDLAANSFFNNRSQIPKPLLEQNQFGGRLGGPVFRNKAFFFGTYEGFRRTLAGAQNETIAAHPGLFQGVWRYVRASDGQVGEINILQAVGGTVDPALQADLFSRIPAASNVNNFDRGDSRADRVLNTAGFRWDQQRLTQRNYFTGRLDVELSEQHRFEGIGSYYKETDDRPDLDFISGPGQRPVAFTSSPVKRYVGAWRWMPPGRFFNELRVGANIAPVAFEVQDGANPAIRFAGQNLRLPLTLMNPQISFFPQGRNTNTYQLSNNGSLMWGRHDLQIGGSWQRIHVNPYNFEGTVPTIGWGFSAAAPTSAQLNSGMFPGGISAAELSSANTMLAMLTGTVSTVTRTFQVRDQNSGFVPGIPNNRNYTLNNVASYIQDNWRWKPNFSIRAGLKWEYYSPVREDDNLGFMPILNGQSFQQVLRDPNASVSFIDGGMWKSDLNNFGPTAGFAWDVFKDGTTAVRGGYSLTFINEEGITVATGTLAQNAGLATGSTLSSLYTRYSAGVPDIPTPTFLTTRTLANQMALSASAPMATIDPDLRQPRVHQVSIGLSRELRWATAVEARYVGTFGRDIWRGVDFNQIQIPQAFIEDFARARSNGYLAVANGLAFNPAFNANVPGSQQLTMLPQFGLFTNATVLTSIQQNEVARLADFYATQRVAGALATFFPNPGIYEARAVLNDGFQDYNALQLEFRRQYRGGIMGGLNYTFANMRANSTGGASQNRFEPYLDNARPFLDTGRSAYNIRHILNGNFIFDFPFGEGRRWLNRGGLVDAIAGGWQLSGIASWQSGSPLGIYSRRGTFNRVTGTPNRSIMNSAVSSLSVDQIRNLFGVFKLPDGRIFWIDPRVVNADGRGVGADNLGNTPGFEGQVFFNPTAGDVGNLPILAFDAPSVWNLNAALSKRVRLVRGSSAEFRIEGFNLTNSVSFYTGDFDINSTTFGRLTQVAGSARVVQLTARFDF